MKSPEERALTARIAAHERWAKTPDRLAATAKARRAADDRFAREVDPSGVLDPIERAKRAASARKAFYLKLALKSAQARKARAKAAELEAQIEAGLRGEIASEVPSDAA